MKEKVFYVPQGSMVEFTTILLDNDLRSIIIGISDGPEFKIAVQYRPADRKVIFDLNELSSNSESDND